ncbi:hypothetical protein AXB11_24820 [Salmonella enterica]|nr:hypothetical protein [Salmonella enterica]
MGEISVKTGNNARNGGKNSLNRLIRCVCGKKIGPDPRNFNQRVSLGRNDLLIRTFPNRTVYDVETIDYISNQINEAGREIKKIHDRAKTQHTQLEARAAQWKEKRFMVAKELSSK